MNTPVRHICQRWLQLAAACLAVATVFSAAAQPLSGAPLLEALQRGGYVLVMRHASSPRLPPERAVAEPDNIHLERQLDETGRMTSRAMGEAIRKLHIPIGDIWSSPTYRALQTIRLASFGEARTVPQLDEGPQGMQAKAEESRTAWLRKAVRIRPRTGTNTLIVTHTPNILGAFGKEASAIQDGETLVFDPNAKGSKALVARIRIQAWQSLGGGR